MAIATSGCHSHKVHWAAYKAWHDVMARRYATLEQCVLFGTVTYYRHKI